ncbi:MAG: sulfatase [Verrucomicrobiota bacterium]
MSRFFLTLAGLILWASTSSAEDRPNVLVFLVDDLGVMDTSLNGEAEPFYETPSLERLASEGVTFTNGYSAHARCVESRFAIQTGRSPWRDSAQTTPAGRAMLGHPTLGEAFLEGGYATAFFGKWHLGKEEAEFPHGRGYTVDVGGCHAGAVASHFFPFHLNPQTGKTGKEGPLLGLEDGVEGENVTDRLTREAAEWIRRHRNDHPDQPFFAFFSHFAVHTPIQGKPDEVAWFTKKAASLPPAFGEDGYLAADGVTKTRRDHPVYASMVKTTDDSLGSMLDLLDELEITEETIVLFTSDHGGLSNRGTTSKRELATSNLPYRAGKGHLYDGGLRVPFLVSWPGTIPEGEISEAFAVGTDIFPTLTELAGVRSFPEHHVDGTSLAPALLDSDPMRERSGYFWHHPLPRPTQTGDQAMSVLRDGKFKLVKTYYPEVAFELYDLKVDPHETTNLAEEKPSRVRRMVAALEEHLTAGGAPPLRQDWKDKETVKPVTAR